MVVAVISLGTLFLVLLELLLSFFILSQCPLCSGPISNFQEIPFSKDVLWNTNPKIFFVGKKKLFDQVSLENAAYAITILEAHINIVNILTRLQKKKSSSQSVFNFMFLKLI